MTFQLYLFDFNSGQDWGNATKERKVMKNIKVKVCDQDEDVQVVQMKKVNEAVDKHFVGILDAIRYGMRIGGRK